MIYNIVIEFYVHICILAVVKHFDVNIYVWVETNCRMPVGCSSGSASFVLWLEKV